MTYLVYIHLGQEIEILYPIRDGDISWTMTSRGHYFSKWATSRGHSQRVTSRGHFFGLG